MSPDQALLSSVLLLMLAWALSVLLPAAWRAHQRGLARVRTAQRRQRALWLYAEPRVLWGARPDPHPLAKPGVHSGACCSHGVPWPDYCPRCRVRV